ncbi:MAG: hypothetical protein F4Y44_03275 [Chloroflexi bacterium]|nr:hypothetical protein [Chloroflexota bacterium]
MNANRLLFGIIVIAVGLLFLLNSSGVADFSNFLKWWPSLIILFGIWRFIASGFRSRFLPILLIAIGAFLQVGELGLDIDWGRYWPVILIAVGILIFAGGMRGRRRRRNRSNQNRSHNASTIIDIDVSASSDAEDDTLHAVAGSQDRIISGDFRDGSINIVMGNGNLDMRDAVIVDKPATLEVSIVMGEVKIRVPRDWNVQIANSATMGEAKDARNSSPSAANAPDLIISGSVVMGSLKIID